MEYSKLKGTSFSKKKRGWVSRFFFFFLLPLFFAYLAYQIYQKQAVIIFYFQKNKYQELSKEQEKIEEKLQGGVEVDQNTIEDLVQKYDVLITQYPSDPFLFYYLGRLNFVLFERQVKRSKTALADTLLSHFLDQSSIAKLSKLEIWQKAVLCLRKALALRLPPEQSADAIGKLAYLYLFAEEVHLKVAGDFLEKGPLNSERDHYYEIAKVVVSSQKPDWAYLKEIFPEYFLIYLKGLHAIRIGNRPRGFFLLHKLIQIKDPSAEMRACIDNALYLMGHLNKRYRKPSQQQIYYYSLIKLDGFMVRHPWFFDEYLFSLRFLGRRQKAKEIQKAYNELLSADK